MQRTGARPLDELYRLYGSKTFEHLEVNEETDPELAKFVKETLTKGPKFSNYATNKLDQFVSRIYELRKDNTNNTTR